MRRFWEWLENVIGDFRGYYPNAYANNPFSFLLAPILGFLFFLFLILGNWKSIQKWFDKSVAKNTITLTVEEPLELERTRIDWRVSYIKSVPIYENGQTTYTEFYEYGENHFIILYDNEVIADIVQFKEEGLSGHHYSFQLSKTDSCIHPLLKIEGTYDSTNWVLRPKCP